MFLTSLNSIHGGPFYVTKKVASFNHHFGNFRDFRDKNLKRSMYVVPKSFKKLRIIDRMLFFLDSIIAQLKEVYVKCIHHVTTRIANCLQENIMSLDILLLFTKALCWRLSMEHVKCINFSQYAVGSKIQNKCIILKALTIALRTIAISIPGKLF